jgi:segregation and condensation protein A
MRRPPAHVAVRADAASGGLTAPVMEAAATTATTDEGEGEGRTPRLAVEGYSGSLEGLLTLARSRRIDMAKISLLELVDQLVAAVRDAAPATPMGQKGDWVVMASWLVQLRSLLLLPADAPAHHAAEDAADHFRNRLSGLGEIQALAAWLDRRPHLGRDVLTRGQPPEEFDPSAEGGPEIDVIEFLWASMALFDDGDPGPDISETYRPGWRELYSVADARARILKRLASAPDGLPLEKLLPEDSATAGISAEPALKERAAWASTFVASLELAKQGEAALAQTNGFSAIHVSPAPADPLA